MSRNVNNPLLKYNSCGSQICSSGSSSSANLNEKCLLAERAIDHESSEDNDSVSPRPDSPRNSFCGRVKQANFRHLL